MRERGPKRSRIVVSLIEALENLAVRCIKPDWKLGVDAVRLAVRLVGFRTQATAVSE